MSRGWLSKYVDFGPLFFSSKSLKYSAFRAFFQKKKKALCRVRTGPFFLSFLFLFFHFSCRHGAKFRPKEKTVIGNDERLIGS